MPEEPRSSFPDQPDRSDPESPRRIPSEHPSWVGREVSHYRIVEKIGEGGMGVVYRGLDLSLGRPVAMKLLPPEKVGDLDRKRRFVQEAKAASALSHPNIVTIYEIAHHENVDYVAMEYIAGRSIHQRIYSGQLTLDRKSTRL